ncbi:unnamed protein product [Fusarium fujikuroi]|nr:unnamed protein product [Fusarium fujikuroi]
MTYTTVSQTNDLIGQFTLGTATSSRALSVDVIKLFRTQATSQLYDSFTPTPTAVMNSQNRVEFPTSTLPETQRPPETGRSCVSATELGHIRRAMDDYDQGI